MSKERRHFSRISFDTVAYLITVDARLAVKVLDLSLKGALLELPESCQIEAGGPCLLSLDLNPGSTEPQRIAMAAEIAHVHGRRVGLLCRSIDLESITHLRRLMEVNLGDATLLDRDLKALVAV